MKIEKVLIMANIHKSEICLSALNIKNFLIKEKVQPVEIVLSGSDKDSDLAIPKADLAVSLGGDGTVLACARLLKDKNIPLLAVKLGTFGYITETSTEEFEEVYRDFVKGLNPVENRMMICAKIIRNNEVILKKDALNDVIISNEKASKLFKSRLLIDKVFAANIRADSIIFSTPTGSTGYNLSAGGPILDADSSSIIINPVCPFSISVRPLVIRDSSKVLVELPQQKNTAVAIFDGQEEFGLFSGDIVEVSKSEYSALLVRNTKRNRIEVLRDKLGWAGGFND